MVDDTMSSFNIIVLSPKEDALTWLNSEVTDITEISEDGKIRRIEIEHPISNEDTDYKEWFKIGNKIWLPDRENSKFGVLYVINTEFELDLWKENTIVFDAEEVIVELNNTDLFSYTSTTPITVAPESNCHTHGEKIWDENNGCQGCSNARENRRMVLYQMGFGLYYNIGIVDYPLRHNPSDQYELNKILPCGTMTLMELLHFIEDSTGNKFETWYYLNEDNEIIRFLNFLLPSNIGGTIKDTLDLGYNTDNIQFNVNEADTFKAIAPVFSFNDEKNRGIRLQNTTATADERNKLQDRINRWRDFRVNKGDIIPNIVEKYTEKENDIDVEKIRYLSYWSAPFTKRSGEIYIQEDAETESTYTKIYPRKDFENGKGLNYKEIPKIKGLSVSEDDVNAIYYACANELIETRTPEVEVEVETHDLDMIFNESNTYNRYDKIFMRLPGYNEVVRGRIAKTTKNLHNPGDNKIIINNMNIGGRIERNETFFNAEDLTLTGNAGKSFTGELRVYERNPNTGEIVSKPLSNAHVTVTVIREASKVETVTTTPEFTNETGANTITVTMKPSCSYNCGEYKNYTKTWENKCNSTTCKGKTGTLKINPKGVPEGEITCGVCSSDYCGVCGRDKMRPSRFSLTPATENQAVQNVSKTSTTEIPGYKNAYTRETDINGVFSLQINLDPFEYKLQLSYGGDILNAPTTSTVNLIVL